MLAGADDHLDAVADAAPERDPAVTRALSRAVNALRAAGSDWEKYKELTDGAKALKIVGAEQKAIDHLVNVALHMHALSADEVQLAVATGTGYGEAEIESRSTRTNGNGRDDGRRAADANDILREHGADALHSVIDAAETYTGGNVAGPAEHVGVSLADFWAYMPHHNYMFAPSRELWPASAVNARIAPIPLLDEQGRPVVNNKGEQKTIPANTWLDKHKAVEQMTWAPGLPMVVHDRLISEGGWIDRKGVACFNLYRPPVIEPGNAAEATPWLNHVRSVFHDDTEHIVQWLGHRVQRPDEKINHALMLGGPQGIGKDTVLEPIKIAIGPWNFAEVSPSHILGRFNGFTRSVILRVSEARDLGDVDRFQFYDRMKNYIAAPPDVLRVDEKNLREYNVLNCCGVIITTNYKTDGIYLPSDDRRHFVAWSNRTKDDFPPEYWNNLWRWYDQGGTGHVAAYLAGLDLSSFDPKSPPPKTAAFWAIVDANRAPEDAELADLLDKLGRPDAMPLSRVMDTAEGEFGQWIRDRKNRRIIPHRLEKCGYVPARNDVAADGLWKIHDRRQVIYAKSTLIPSERIKAARAVI